MQGYFLLLDSIFNPIISLPPFIAELLLAVMISFIITLFYKFLINQDVLRNLKEEMKAKQEKIKEVQKNDPKEANKVLNELLALSRKQMRLTIKPMILTFILVIILLPWMAYVFKGPVVKLPFSLPFFGDDFGFLAWYIITTFPLSQLFRKLMGVEL
jgi:uncharacterized membrane protein (DUF106 family)